MGLYKKRKDGSEQPSMLGPLKLRLPFIHYKLEYPDWIQGAILCVVPMGITAVMMDVLGIPFELAIAFVVINNFLYLLHTHFGDPSIAGWITAGIPLYVGFLVGFPEGDARILALIALQLTVALIFLIMGLFKGADILVKRLPTSLKAGILLGAGFAAIYGEFSANGRVWTMPVTILLGAAFGFFMMFSRTAAPLREKYSFFRYIAQFGIAIPFAVSYIFGLVIGEVAAPNISWNLVPLPIGEIIANYSIFGVGFPPFEYFLKALPLAIAAYIIAFGDILVVSSLLNNANEVRKDERIVFSASRNSIIVSIRNFIEGIFMPYLPLSGPQWTAGQVLVVNRFMSNGRSQVDSYWGGATGIFWGMSIALMLGPVVSIFQPGINIGMALTMLIQGYLCGYLAMDVLKEKGTLEKGIAVIVGAVLATQGAAWGLGVGIVLWLLLERNWFKDEDKKVNETRIA
ncbi:hypothetical protein ACFFHH_11310 [Cytobacillus solani]|uniref:Xanthine/uracil/vitamin C permease n=1 Tax=Cytobacillus solani TaxID=1637975 RepID=A0A0Q3QTI5_9BACI|nr:hypothetical protein [Cytobacillus solani]KOP83778.1 hypothetical protein AMS60_15520 [Bacillus sp. FJAT-21945]KQL20856.1 hypothetical protein AN957_21145 [Cytobacillus solani]USK54095.1 hypothetical protein LIS82_21225 [Cytobacillus solani]